MRGGFIAISLVTGELQEPMSAGGGHVHDDVDLRFHDRVALEEIELYAEVLSAVAIADRPLTNDEIDEVLGLDTCASAQAHAY
jgi:hypothetical protein